MGRLTDAARESFDVSKNRVKAPDWLPRVGLIVFVGAMATIFILSLGGGSEQAGPITTVPPKVVIPGATTVPQGGPSSTTPGNPAATTPSNPGTTVPQNGGGSEAVVTLSNGSGGTTQIPNSAYQLALTKARETFPTGTLIETRATATETSIEFVVVWDPDGTGPSPRETLIVNTQKTGETWQIVPS